MGLSISLVVSFLYFGVFQFFTKGRTLGKTLLGIEVISTDKKELRITQTIIRSSIIEDANKSILGKNDLIISYVTLVNNFNECIIKIFKFFFHIYTYINIVL